jgi:hypothetical protein
MGSRLLRVSRASFAEAVVMVRVLCLFALWLMAAPSLASECTTQFLQNTRYRVTWTGGTGSTTYAGTSPALACQSMANARSGGAYSLAGMDCSLLTDGAPSYTATVIEFCTLPSTEPPDDPLVTTVTCSSACTVTHVLQPQTVTAVVTPVTATQEQYDAVNLIFAAALLALVLIWGGKRLYALFTKPTDA